MAGTWGLWWQQLYGRPRLRLDPELGPAKNSLCCAWPFSLLAAQAPTHAEGRACPVLAALRQAGNKAVNRRLQVPVLRAVKQVAC